MEQNPAPVPREILARYADYDEQSRLSNTRSVGFEFLRSQELILRHMQPPPQKVLDVGGSPGVYSLWLASLEHEVHLIDPVQNTSFRRWMLPGTNPEIPSHQSTSVTHVR